MLLSYEEKVNINYLWIKYKYVAARIVNNRPECEWKVNGLKKLLKKTDDISRKEGSGWLKSVRTEENIELKKKWLLAKKSTLCL